jgi:signal transduction histidine kinase/integral membrane sensor domain MASE1
MYPRLRASNFLGIGIIGGIYFATAFIGLRLFDPVSGFASLVWPPAGIAVAVLVIFGKRLWPGIAAGAFLANAATGAPIIIALGIGVGNALEALVAAYAFEHTRFSPGLKRVRDVVMFVFWGAMVAPSVSATIGVCLLWVSGIVSTNTFDHTWIAWWVGDALGVLIFAPVLFSIYHIARPVRRAGAIAQKIRALGNMPRLRFIEIICLSITLFVGGFFIFWSDAVANTALPFLYLAILPPLWTGLRFGQRAAAWAILAIASIGVTASFFDYGPFAYSAHSENLLMLQIFIGVMSIKSLIYAALKEEQRTAERRASLEHSRLAEIVEARTAELQKQTVALAERNRDIESARATYETLLEAIESAVVAVDSAGMITYLNQAAATIWGKPRAALLDTPGTSAERHYLDLYGRPIPPEERPLPIAINKGVTTSMRCMFLRGENERVPLFISASPIRAQGIIIGAVAVFSDITKDFEAEQSKFKFVTVVSHQFRTPISIIRWYAEALLGPECGPLTDRQRQLVNEIHHTTKRIAKLIGLMLDVTKIELGIVPAFTAETVYLTTSITGILQNLNEEISAKGLSVNVSDDGNRPMVNIHRHIVEIILGNIIDNAIRYTPAGGTIQIRIALDRERNMVMTSIEDTGYGIPADEHAKIFSDLFRGSNIDEVSPSGGFGLYIVKSLLTIVHGEVGFISQQGVGSTFSVALPRAQSTEGRAVVV